MSMGEDAATRMRQAMRRRVKVFAGVFLGCLVLSQGFNFMRPAIYRAGARVEITPPGQVVATPVAGAPAVRNGSGGTGGSLSTANAPAGTPAFLAEVQVLSSRPLLEKAVKTLQEHGYFKNTAGDPVQAAQAMLSVTPLDGTQIVQLQAQGSEAPLTAQLLNALLQAYADQQVASSETSAQGALDDARKEVQVIDAKVLEKRKAMDAYKQRSNIVSGERDENEALARVKGLNTSLATATDREAVAAGRVRALEQAATEGKRAPLAKDNPTVAGMEARLSQMREEWRGLERQFTPQYLDMDPNARALKSRISNLEQQLEAERQKSTQMALADAREELASAQATTQRLRQQLTEGRQGVQSFSRQFGDFQGMQTELTGLEQMQQTAKQKLLALEASESARKPRLQVLEPAVVPDSAWSPQYGRDAGIGLLGSLLLGFLAVWFVEFFNRTEPAQQPQAGPTIVVQQPWMAMPQHPGAQQLGAPAPPHMGVLEQHPGNPGAPLLLTHPLPRELRHDEVAQLLAAAAPESVPLLACLLCGLSAAELVALQVRHVDGANGVLRVPGESERAVPLPAPLQGLPAPNPAENLEAPLFSKAGGRALDQEDINTAVTSSAFDAALDQPQSITPEALRHTYVAFLVRQGLRFGELGRLAGRLSADAINALAPLAPEGQRISLDMVEKLLPALRG
jgi:uncharacterized protein involved in exopolysaccharide biosynthesis